MPVCVRNPRSALDGATGVAKITVADDGAPEDVGLEGGAATFEAVEDAEDDMGLSESRVLPEDPGSRGDSDGGEEVCWK